MISGQDRKLAEETFRIIDDSQDAGYEMNLPIGTSDPDGWAEAAWRQDVSTALAEHTAATQAAIIEASK